MIENIIYNNQTVAKYNSSKENPFVSMESPEECHIISGIFFFATVLNPYSILLGHNC